MIHRARLPLYGGQLVVCVARDPLVSLRRAGLPTGWENEDVDDVALCKAWIAERPLDPDEVDDSDTETSFGRWVVALRPNASLNTVAHESLHLVLHVARYYCLPTQGAEAEEPLAYLMGWVTDLLWGLVERAR